MEHMWIHVINLKGNKWFLHTSTTSSDKPKQIFQECATLYEYARENRPVTVFESIPFVNTMELNAIVKQYMRYYGVDNVRGGSYSESILPDFMLKTLEVELADDNAVVETSLRIYENVYSTYKELLQNTDACAMESQKLKVELSNYRNIVETCESICVSRVIFDDFEWIKLYVENVRDFYQNDSAVGKYPLSSLDNLKYKTTIRKMNGITAQFYKMVENPPVEIGDLELLLQEPHVYFNYAFYHPNLVTDWDMYCSNAVLMLEKFEYMSWFLINRFEEYQFDLGTYDPDFETSTVYATHLLDAMV